MKMKWKNVIIGVIAAAVFFWQIKVGLAPPAPPAPGEMASGGAPATAAVAFSALLSALLVWALLEALFWAYAKIKGKNR